MFINGNDNIMVSAGSVRFPIPRRSKQVVLCKGGMRLISGYCEIRLQVEMQIDGPPGIAVRTIPLGIH